MGEFFDARDGGPLRLELRSVDGRDFTLLRRLGYATEEYPEPFVVPRDLEDFATDFASVPHVFTWPETAAACSSAASRTDGA